MVSTRNFTQSIKLAVAQKIFPQFDILQKLGRYEANYFGTTIEDTSLTKLCSTIVTNLVSTVEDQQSESAQP